MTPAEVRLTLHRAGFTPLPVVGKRPILDGWQKHTDVTAHEIERWTRACPAAENTGILTRLAPVLDIDIVDPEAAEAVERLARERFEEHGYVLVRFGAPPKRAIPFRTDAPFAKIVARLVAPDGSDGQRLELMCDGQQMVVDGVHPNTHRPYSWHGGALGQIQRLDLPYLHEEEARQLVDDAAELLIRDFGYRLPERRAVSTADSVQGNGGADWSQYFANLSDHDELTGLAMSLLRSGMNDGPAVNFLRCAVGGLANVDPDRRQRRLKEIPDMVASARAKLDDGKKRDAEQQPGGKAGADPFRHGRNPPASRVDRPRRLDTDTESHSDPGRRRRGQDASRAPTAIELRDGSSLARIARRGMRLGGLLHRGRRARP
jgi:bifunctional DNA primase/polymerase-like protein